MGIFVDAQGKPTGVTHAFIRKDGGKTLLFGKYADKREVPLGNVLGLFNGKNTEATNWAVTVAHENNGSFYFRLDYSNLPLNLKEDVKFRGKDDHGRSGSHFAEVIAVIDTMIMQ